MFLTRGHLKVSCLWTLKQLLVFPRLSEESDGPEGHEGVKVVSSVFHQQGEASSVALWVSQRVNCLLHTHTHPLSCTGVMWVAEGRSQRAAVVGGRACKHWI